MEDLNKNKHLHKNHVKRLYYSSMCKVLQYSSQEQALEGALKLSFSLYDSHSRSSVIFFSPSSTLIFALLLALGCVAPLKLEIFLSHHAFPSLIL